MDAGNQGEPHEEQRNQNTTHNFPHFFSPFSTSQFVLLLSFQQLLCLLSNSGAKKGISHHPTDFS
jgi:hypothetical protein